MASRPGAASTASSCACVSYAGRRRGERRGCTAGFASAGSRHRRGVQRCSAARKSERHHLSALSRFRGRMYGEVEQAEDEEVKAYADAYFLALFGGYYLRREPNAATDSILRGPPRGRLNLSPLDQAASSSERHALALSSRLTSAAPATAVSTSGDCGMRLNVVHPASTYGTRNSAMSAGGRMASSARSGRTGSGRSAPSPSRRACGLRHDHPRCRTRPAWRRGGWSARPAAAACSSIDATTSA